MTAPFAILTCTYNAERFLADALASVDAQHGVSCTHILQDAGSTDGTVDVVSGFGGYRVRLGVEDDAGLADGWNRALERCPADTTLVGWLNADEYYLPNTLAWVEDFFFGHPNIDVLYGDTLLVDAEGCLQRRLAQHRYDDKVLQSYGCYIQTASCFFRRSALGDEPLDKSLAQSMDWDLFLRLRAEGRRFQYVPRVFSAFKVHSDQLTGRNGAERAATEHATILARYGLEHRPRYGRWRHVAQKLAGGAYIREARAARYREQPTTWFESPAALAVVNGINKSDGGGSVHDVSIHG
jgi:glycosyltransferase involved in cell wall biosynthesis